MSKRNSNMTFMKIINEQLQSFIKLDHPKEVIAIRGVWGSGKTYFWKGFINDNKKIVQGQNYAYVSLFGITTIDELKYTIIDMLEIKEGALLDKMRQTTAKYGGKLVNLAEMINGPINFNIDFKYFSSGLIKNAIICLDDFERTQLDPQILLGFISDLKEQNGCKMVLIMNDEAFSLNTKISYSTYREKVIDKEFSFSPTPDESFRLVFHENDQYAVILKEKCKMLGIKNIRVLNKIKWLNDTLSPLLKDVEAKTHTRILSSLVLLSHCFYTKNEEIPTFDFVIGLEINNSIDLLLGNKQLTKEDSRRKEQQWLEFLKSYGYGYTDELDRRVGNFVQDGYFDHDLMQEAINEYNEVITIENSKEAFSQVWDLYHQGFNTDEDELVRNFYEVTRANIKVISAIHLSEVISLFRDLGQDIKADELIDLAIDSHDNPDYFDINAYVFGNVQDAKLIKQFEKAYLEKKIKQTPEEVLDRIIGASSYSKKDMDILCEMSVSYFRNLLESTDNKKSRSYAQYCLELARIYETPSPEQKLIAKIAEDALKEIAQTSNLNRRKVKLLGVDIEYNDKILPIAIE